MQPRATEVLQARDQARAPPEAQRGVRGHPQGGLLQVQEEPQEGPEARRQEVVLRPHRGVRPRLRSSQTPRKQQQGGCRAPLAGRSACARRLPLSQAALSMPYPYSPYSYFPSAKFDLIENEQDQFDNDDDDFREEAEEEKSSDHHQSFALSSGFGLNPALLLIFHSSFSYSSFQTRRRSLTSS